MQAESFLQYSELAYAAVVVCALVYLWLRIRRKSHQVQEPGDKGAMEVADPKPIADDLALRSRAGENSVSWWNHQDFPYSAPWWLRYPASIAVFAGSYWAFFEWTKKAGWIVGVLFAVIGLGLVRELFVGAVVAVLAGLTLWALGAAVAALPVSAAIIIGAMIIAQAVRR